MFRFDNGLCQKNFARVHQEVGEGLAFADLLFFFEEIWGVFNGTTGWIGFSGG